MGTCDQKGFIQGKLWTNSLITVPKEDNPCEVMKNSLMQLALDRANQCLTSDFCHVSTCLNNFSQATQSAKLRNLDCTESVKNNL